MQGIEIEEAFIRDFGRKIGKGSPSDAYADEASNVSDDDDEPVYESDDWPNAEECRIAERVERRFKRICYLCLVAAIIFLCSVLNSCTTVKYVPVESNSSIKDSLRIRDSLVVRNVVNQKDSVILRDSVVQVVDESGKVIRTELYRYKEVNRNLSIENERLKKALEEARTQKVDSIQVPVLIEKPLSRWQQFKLDIGEIAFLVIGIMIIKMIFEFAKKKHPS